MSNWLRFNVAGVTHDNRQKIIRKYCKAGDSAELRREPNNKFDSNAVAVYVRGRQIGYVPAELSERIAPGLDSGLLEFIADVYRVESFETDNRDQQGRFTSRKPETIWIVELDVRWRHATHGVVSGRTSVSKRKPKKQNQESELQPTEQPQFNIATVTFSVASRQSTRSWADVGRAILADCRGFSRICKSAFFGTLKTIDHPIRRLAGDDRVFLLILRFVVFAVVIGLLALVL